MVEWGEPNDSKQNFDRLSKALSTHSPDAALLVMGGKCVEWHDETMAPFNGCHSKVLPLAVLDTQNEVLIGQWYGNGLKDAFVPPLRSIDLLPKIRKLAAPLQKPKGQRPARPEGLDDIVGQSHALLATLQLIPPIAKSDVGVLIQGETGTGKELCARAVHYLSARSDKPFVAVNCGAIPVDLIENELFGHEVGAFTGATGNTCGIIGQANGGTLFLDEIDALPLGAQVKLLRFLQNREIRSLGGRKARIVDTRIVAASNSNLEELVAKGEFRQDFYYRLSVASVELPPLRNRNGDLEILANHFLSSFRRKSNHRIEGFTNEALRKMAQYHWPGNIRELEHVTERAAILCPERRIKPEHLNLPNVSSARARGTFQTEKHQVVYEFERSYLREVMITFENNISAAAKSAGKDRRAFWELLKKHDLLPISASPKI